jgi:integrase
MQQKRESLWEATAVQNLFRYRPSGTYFVRFKVGRRPIRQSLETTIFSVAKQRLPDKIREHRATHESGHAFASGRMKVADSVQIFLSKTETNASIKPRTKAYYRALMEFVQRSWPTLYETDIRKVSERDCEEWLANYQKHYAPTVVNNSIAILREVFQEAIRAGARFNNPAATLSRVRVYAKRLELPSREQFLRFVEEIRIAGARQSKDCANLVKFLAYSGLRIGEARYVTWADANLQSRQLHVRGDPVTATKNGETRFVPMIPELEQMLRELRQERAHEPATGRKIFER